MQIGVVFQTAAIDKVMQAYLVEAWDRQSEEFCKAHGIPYVPVVLYDTIPEDEIANGEIRVMTVSDTIDVDGALGYHTDEMGLIFACILAGNNAESGSHECCEETRDPDCSIWKPMGDGRETAYESCDAVEGDSYMQDATIGDETRQIPVTNYLLPSWFDPNGQHPFDRMGKLTAPFTMTDGGYMAVRDASGNETDVFAEARVEHGGERGKLAAMKKRAKPDSRLSRRLRPRVEPPVVTPIGNMNDLLEHVPAPEPSLAAENPEPDEPAPAGPRHHVPSFG